MAEWSKALDSKSSIRLAVSWVRIPFPPWLFLEGWPSWSKAHDWKSCISQKGIVGSNPTPSVEGSVQVM